MSRDPTRATGRIVEHGSHEQLLTERGRCAAMFALQAEGYR